MMNSEARKRAADAKPSPAEFLTSSAYADLEDGPASCEPTDELLGDVLRRLTALEDLITGSAPSAPPAEAKGLTEEVTVNGADSRYLELEQAYADLDAKFDVLNDLVEEIRGIVKPSTSKVSLAVKAAIDAWASPELPEEPEGPGHTCFHCEAVFPDVVALQAHGTRAHGADFDYRDGGAPPGHDASIEEWVAYARSALGPEAEVDLDRMNRSQIRTMLGLSHPGEQPVPA